MNLYIPAQGDEIELTQDWQFEVSRNYQNRILIEKFSQFDPTDRPWYDRPPVKIMLDAGTILIVDRIYVRKNPKDAEVSLRVKWCPNPKVGKARIYVSTDQANTVEYKKVV